MDKECPSASVGALTHCARLDDANAPAPGGGCRFPGCHHQRWLNAHHIRYWLDGGPTDLDNLILLCPHHHRMLHEVRWRIEGDPNGAVTWIRPDGRPYLSKCGP